MAVRFTSSLADLIASSGMVVRACGRGPPHPPNGAVPPLLMLFHGPGGRRTAACPPPFLGPAAAPACAPRGGTERPAPSAAFRARFWGAGGLGPTAGPYPPACLLGVPCAAASTEWGGTGCPSPLSRRWDGHLWRARPAGRGFWGFGRTRPHSGPLPRPALLGLPCAAGRTERRKHAAGSVFKPAAPPLFGRAGTQSGGRGRPGTIFGVGGPLPRLCFCAPGSPSCWAVPSGELRISNRLLLYSENA